MHGAEPIRNLAQEDDSGLKSEFSGFQRLRPRSHLHRWLQRGAAFSVGFGDFLR